MLCRAFLSFFRAPLMNCLGSAGGTLPTHCVAFRSSASALIKKMKVTLDKGWKLAVAFSHHCDYLAI